MNTTVTIQQWGNSQGIRLTKALLTSAGISVGDTLKIETKGNRIFIQQDADTNIRKMTSDEIFSSIPKDYQTQEYDWGKSMGKEIW